LTKDIMSTNIISTKVILTIIILVEIIINHKNSYSLITSTTGLLRRIRD